MDHAPQTVDDAQRSLRWVIESRRVAVRYAAQVLREVRWRLSVVEDLQSEEGERTREAERQLAARLEDAEAELRAYEAMARFL